MTPRCLSCLTEDVMVKVTGPYGAEFWFCAEDFVRQMGGAPRMPSETLTVVGKYL